MALDFASGQYVNHGDTATLVDLPDGAMTVWAWVRRDSDGANQYIASKDGSFPSGWGLVCDNGPGEGALRFIVFRTDGTGSNWTDYISGSGEIALNTWTFVCATYDDTLGTEVDLYTGTLSDVATETSYGTTQNGTGAALGDTASDLYVGNLARGTTNAFLGKIARGGIITRVLTLAEVRQLQFATMAAANVVDGVLLFDYFGTGTQKDHSGNGNTGTVVSATATSGIPLSRLDFSKSVSAAAAAAASGGVLGALAGRGGLAGPGGIAGSHGGIAG